MKKLIIKSLSLSVISITLFLSCASNKTLEPVTSDTYETEEESSVIEKNTKKADKKAKKDKISPNALPNSKNAFESFFTFGNKDDIVVFDSSSVFTEKIGSGIKQQKSDIILNAKDTTLFGFGTPYMAAYYILFMNDEGRTKLSKAYDLYLSDFENKKLNRNNKKSLKMYGEIDVNLKWGSLSMSTPNFGSGKAQIGYEFYKGSPYFVISNYPIHNGYFEIVKEAATTESMRLKFYFTKAQMKDLLEKLNQGSIDSVIRSYYPESLYDLSNEDAYEDYDDEILEEIEE